MSLNRWTRNELRRCFNDGLDFESACEKLGIISQDVVAAQRYWDQLAQEDGS